METLLKQSLLFTSAANGNEQETALKQSLLLTHGTIYGVASPLAWRGFDGISATVSNGIAPKPGDSDFPFLAAPITNEHGPLTDNTPIDVVHWTGTGYVHPEGLLSWWNDCLSLLMRHI